MIIIMVKLDDLIVKLRLYTGVNEHRTKYPDFRVWIYSYSELRSHSRYG